MRGPAGRETAIPGGPKAHLPEKEGLRCLDTRPWKGVQAGRRHTCVKPRIHTPAPTLTAPSLSGPAAQLSALGSNPGGSSTTCNGVLDAGGVFPFWWGRDDDVVGASGGEAVER